MRLTSSIASGCTSPGSQRTAFSSPLLLVSTSGVGSGARVAAAAAASKGDSGGGTEGAASAGGAPWGLVCGSCPLLLRRCMVSVRGVL